MNPQCTVRNVFTVRHEPVLMLNHAPNQDVWVSEGTAPRILTFDIKWRRVLKAGRLIFRRSTCYTKNCVII